MEEVLCWQMQTSMGFTLQLPGQLAKGHIQKHLDFGGTMNFVKKFKQKENSGRYTG